MGKIIYITGGARSGKSSAAEKIALTNYKDRIYLATAIPYDNEMKDRISKHLVQRGENWTTVEGYKNIPKLLESTPTKSVVLLDCLTNMMSNLLLENDVDWDNIKPDKVNELEADIVEKVGELLEFIKNYSGDFIIVSNELGLGLVPAYPLGRYFRDISGRVNQIVAKASDEAYIIVSGLELKLK